MIKAFRRDLSYLRDSNIDPDCEGCGGGYGEHLKSYDAIYVDSSAGRNEAILIAIHEVLELDFKVDHDQYDRTAERIHSALQQLKLI